jgi:hypothetical protein
MMIKCGKLMKEQYYSAKRQIDNPETGYIELFNIK